MNLSLLQPVYTVPLWHFWVEIAHGGSCMNCSFRRMILSFSSEAVCYYLMVTVHCGLSHPFKPTLDEKL